MHSLKSYSLALSIALGATLVAGACRGKKTKKASGVQWYQLEILSDLAPVPFELRLDFPLKESGVAIIANGEQRLTWPMTCQIHSPEVASCAVNMEIYGSKLLLDLDSRAEIQGIWERDPYFNLDPLEIRGKAIPSLESAPRFGEATLPSLSIDGAWRLELGDGSKGKARFRQSEDGQIVGSLTPSELGDTDYLVGRMTGRRVQLSKFDGQRAYLVELKVAPDGKSFTGTWDLPGSEQTLLTGYRGNVPELEELYGLKLKSDDRRVSLPELEKLRGKPVIVDLYGSWCPLCGDAVIAIKDLAKANAETDLEIVSIAYEATENAVLAKQRVDAFHKQYDVPWDSAIRLGDVEEALPPELGGKGFPITLFVNRDGTVHAMNTGFISEASPEDNKKLLGKFRQWTAEIIASPVSGAGSEAGESGTATKASGDAPAKPQ